MRRRPLSFLRSARDRDRLRQAVLESHGWIIHRIWSTDWFQRPTEQLRKVANAIKQAKVAIDENTRHEVAQLNLICAVESEKGIERETKGKIDENGINGLAIPYSEASFEVPNQLDPHKLATRDMVEILLRVVEHEGPIHEDELVARVRDLWGLGRAGNRIQDAVAKGVRSLLATRRCTREDGFLSIRNKNVPIRNRENVSSATLRKPDLLPPAEIRAAILVLIDTHHGAARQEIPNATARIFGFKNTSSQLREIIESQLGKLLRLGTIQEENGMLKHMNA